MAKIFSFNSDYSGSYIDSVSGQAGVNSNGEFKKTEKGIAWKGNGSDSVITLPSTITLSKDSSTVVIWFKGWDAATNEFLIGDDTSAFGYVGRVSGELRIEAGVNGEYWLRKTTTLENDKWYCLVVISNAGTANSYLNGELIDTQTANYDLDLSYIGNYSTPNLGWKGYISKIELYNHAFSTQERNNAYKDFLRPKATGTSIYKNDYPIKPTDLSRLDGLVAAYNMIPSPNGVLTDISGNGNNGIIHGAISTKNGMKFDGVDDYIRFNNIVLDYQLGFTINFNGILNSTSNNYPILGLDTNAKSLLELDGEKRLLLESDTNGDVAYATIITDKVSTFTVKCLNGIVSIYQDGAALDITSNPIEDNLTLNQICRARNIVYGNCEIQDIQFWNRALTEQEIKNYHNQFVKPAIIEDFKYDPVGSFPKEWKKGTGEYSVQEYPHMDTVNSQIPNGGGVGTTDWVDSSGNGLADGFSQVRVVNPSIVTSNGFDGNAQRVEINPGSSNCYLAKDVLTIGKKYKISYKYRTNAEVRENVGSKTYTSNTGNAVKVEHYGIAASPTFALYCIGNGGDWAEFDEINVIEVQELPTGTKYLECNTAGTAAIQSETAYGEWEFDINVDSFPFIYIINQTKGTSGYQGYRFAIGSDGRLYFQKDGGTLFTTNTSYANLNTKYTVKIRRTADGEFTVYIKGGDFGNDYVLIDVTGGTGSNPIVDNTYTESKYIVANLYQNDWITNLKVTNGIKQ